MKRKTERVHSILNTFLFLQIKGMKKSKRSKVSQRKDGVDLISNMPDAILLLILSRLPSTKEAIRSSILSRRWRNLWTAIPSLDIRYRKKFKKTKFKEFVYWVLANKTVDLDRFRLCCDDYYSMSRVWRWTHMAVNRNVKQLDVSFYPKDETKAIEFPHCLVTCGSLEVLSFHGSYISSRLSLPRFKGFLALRFLKLTDVDLLDDRVLVEDFLESCPSLEDLFLSDCVLCKLDLLCISCPKLKTLSIDCEDEDGRCCDIKLSCPKLVDLDLTGHIRCNSFNERLDSLKQAVIEPKLAGNTISVLFPGISGVESLWIDLCFFSKCIDAAHDPSLPNLKILWLTTTMDDFTMENFNQVLKYYPKLKCFKMNIEKDFHGKYQWLGEAKTKRILSRDVKRVEFFKFNGEQPKLVIDWTIDILLLFFTWVLG
ncbi:F-box/LRR-repeat protein At3g26922 [Lactuca sativa]|uniref:F-box/LRR-repeat protein At3g26922 n=1 Tax=Lactuca sativa TaxID=4236 RepID=UPI000CD92B40|nr:F-box/LRR-repeat protein At3g26922 [Lactuca sativa]